MKHVIDLQNACSDALPISEDQLTAWAEAALSGYPDPAEITLRLVDTEEITTLNKTYRKQDKPTNVLSFPGHVPQGIALEHAFLGDVVICPAILAVESQEQNTTLEAHWAHIVIHGILHLLGYDHIEEDDFKIMQAIEVTLLASLGFEDPYHQEEHVE